MSGSGRRSGRSVGIVALWVVALLLAACAPARSAAPAPGQAPAGAGAPQARAGQAGAPAAPAQAPTPPARVQMKTAFTTASATVAPVWVAFDSGVFAEEGIDAEISFIGAGQAILGALSSQEAPIVFAGANQVIDANLQGGQFVVLGAAIAYITTGVWTVPAIQKPEDLRGKTVGVSNFGAISHVALKVALDHWGLEEGRDVTVIRSGGTPETLASMQSGAIHGGSFGAPQSFRARDMGFRELLDVATLRYELPTSSIISTRAYVAEHPDVTERYLRAIMRSIHLLRTNKELALAAIMQYGRIDDRAVAEETWAYYQDKFNDDLVVLPRAIENNLRLIAEEKPEALQAKVEQFLDSSFVERIKASGYLEQIRRGTGS